MEQLTKIAILDETVEYYSKNPRATNKGYCVYVTVEGNLCGHSRCVKPELRAQIMELGDEVNSNDVFNRFGDEAHLEQYQGHDEGFWANIQQFHDEAAYWKEGGLSDTGIEHLRKLKDLYA